MASVGNCGMHPNSIGFGGLHSSRDSAGMVADNSGAFSGPNSHGIVNGAAPHCRCNVGLKTGCTNFSLGIVLRKAKGHSC